MPVTTDAHFSFVSRALPASTFSVVRFTGTEGLSRLYEYEILVSSADAEIDLEEVLRSPATLTIHGHEDDVRVHGAVARFEQLQEIRGRFLYRARLVPRWAQSDLYRENQLFLDKTVPEIIEAILKQVGLSGSDYTLKLKRSYPKWEYICQHEETDFAFVSRWMEREGIYYFFEQGEDAETLVVTDSADAHEEMAGGSLRYAPRSAMVADRETVTSILCRQAWLPHRVILRDYNYRKPSLELKAEAVVDSKGRGDVFSWGEHFKTPEEGKRLAEVRAEEIRCTGRVFHGEATAPAMRPGALFSLEDHYRDSCNRQYLIVEVTHEGAQPEAYVSDAFAQRAEDGPALEYRNSFSAIASDVQYRPARKTPRPQIGGTVNARVDAAGGGQYAEVDDQGRYKVRLPFDESGAAGGKASRWVRMAQPHAGPNYGIHFPLHKGAEVLLTFVDGDPDRPVIAAAVPNPETASPVTAGNQTQSVIRTGGQNEIVIEDTEGGQKVTIQQACGNSFVLDGRTGAESMTMRQACGNSFVLDGTKGAEQAQLKDKYGNQVLLDSTPGDEHITIHSPHHDSGLELGRSAHQWTKSNGISRTWGNQLGVVAGTNASVTLGSNATVKVGNVFSGQLAMESNVTVGGRQTVEMGYSYTFKRGAAVENCGADKVSTADDDQIIEAGDKVGLLGGRTTGAKSAALNLSGSKAVLSIGPKPPRPPASSAPVGALAALAAYASAGASLAAGSVVGLKGVSSAGTGVTAGFTALLGLIQLCFAGAIFHKTAGSKVEPFEHRSPVASLKLFDNGNVILHSETKHIQLQALNGDIYLAPGPRNSVVVGKSVRVAPTVVRIGSLEVRR